MFPPYVRRSPLLAGVLALASLLTVSTSAHAAVPVSGSTYSPRDGAELVEAAKLVSGLPEGDGSEVRIELASAIYSVSEPVVVAPKRPVVISGADGEDDQSLLTNAGAPGKLLDLRGVSKYTRTTVRHVDVDVEGSSASAFPVVTLRGFADAIDVSIGTPTGAPATTAAALTGDATIDTGEILSHSTSAAALTLGSDSEGRNLDLSGGNPVVRMTQEAPSQINDSQAFLWNSTVSAGPAAAHVVEVVPKAGAQQFDIRNSELKGGPATTSVIDVAGPTGPPSPVDEAFDLVVSGVTVLGGPAKATGATFHAGVAGSESHLVLAGFLQLDAPTAVSCENAAGGQPYTVAVRGIYREGALAGAPNGCTYDEQEHRTGDPRFRDRANGDLEPLLGSSLLDAAPTISYLGPDLAGNPRPSEPSCCRNGAPGVDIGAIEYQYTLPVIDEVLIAEPGNRGLVQLQATAHDSSPEEDAQYGVTYTWRFSDGTEATGSSPEHRFTLPPNTRFEDWYPWVELYVYDASGAEPAYRNIELYPWIAECEPATDDPSYEPVALCPEGPTPVPFSGGSTPTPRPRPTAVPTPTPKVLVTPKPAPPFIQQFEFARSKAKARAKRPTGIGSAKPVEAFARLKLSAPGRLTVAVAKRSGKKYSAISKATTEFTVPAGIQFLHVGPRVGKAKLKPGVYRFTLGVTPQAGGPTTTSTVLIRIAR